MNVSWKICPSGGESLEMFKLYTYWNLDGDASSILMIWILAFWNTYLLIFNVDCFYLLFFSSFLLMNFGIYSLRFLYPNYLYFTGLWCPHCFCLQNHVMWSVITMFLSPIDFTDEWKWGNWVDEGQTLCYEALIKSYISTQFAFESSIRMSCSWSN